MFFRTEPCLPFEEKARVEYYLQQLVECVGAEAMRLPVLIPEDRFVDGGKMLPLDEILLTVGEHLQYDVGPVSIRKTPQMLNVCGGGG